MQVKKTESCMEYSIEYLLR